MFLVLEDDGSISFSSLIDSATYPLPIKDKTFFRVNFRWGVSTANSQSTPFNPVKVYSLDFARGNLKELTVGVNSMIGVTAIGDHPVFFFLIAIAMH